MSLSWHDSPRPQSLLQKPYAKLEVTVSVAQDACGRAGTLVANSMIAFAKHSLKRPAPPSPFHSVHSFYEPEPGTPSLQLSPAALSDADEEDHMGPWKILIQDISKWLHLSQYMEAVFCKTDYK